MEILKKNLNVLILAVAIVFVWRGIWGLADLHLLPNSPTISFIASIVIGVIILLLHKPKQKDISELL